MHTIKINNQEFELELVDNQTVAALSAQFPLTMRLAELHGNEKYGTLPERLPTNPQRNRKIEAGDVMLFGSDCLVLFYENFSTSYSYTPLGRIIGAPNLKKIVGKSSVDIFIG